MVATGKLTWGKLKKALPRDTQCLPGPFRIPPCASTLCTQWGSGAQGCRFQDSCLRFQDSCTRCRTTPCALYKKRLESDTEREREREALPLAAGLYTNGTFFPHGGQLLTSKRFLSAHTFFLDVKITSTTTLDVKDETTLRTGVLPQTKGSCLR